jgi:hypothetical protein
MILVAGLTACGGGGWIKDHPDVAERARTEPGAFVEPAFDRSDSAHSLYASYRLRVSKGIGRRTLDVAVSVGRPALVDILVLDPTGAIQASLRANEREVGLYVAEEGILYRGPATQDAFARALGFDLSAADAVAVLLGYGVERSTLPPGVARWDGAARRVRVDYGERASLWLHPITGRFDRVLHRSGRDRVEASIAAWAMLEGPPTPRDLQLSVEPDGYGIRLTLSADPALDYQFPPGYFELELPPGALELPLEELARQGGLFRRTGVK